MIIFHKSREDLIQSLQFFYFLSEIRMKFESKYSRTKNPLIESFLKLLKWFWSWQQHQVKDYAQLLRDYPFWISRDYYREKFRKFIADELSALDFTAEIIYGIRSDTRKARDLREDFRLQATIKLDPKSLGFSKSLLGLTPILEGFDEDPDQSFLTEEEFGNVIQNVWVKLEKYFSPQNDNNFQLQSIMLLFTGIIGIYCSFLKPEIFNLLSEYFNSFTN